MGIPAYMSITGEQSGSIQGECTIENANKKDHIELIEIEHVVEVGFNLLSGGPEAKRNHSPFKVTSKIGKHTALLYEAMKVKDKLKIEIKWFDAASGKDPYFVYTLTDAYVVHNGIRKPNVLDPDEQKTPDMNDMWFSYRRIDCEDKETGIIGGDDWAEKAS